MKLWHPNRGKDLMPYVLFKMSLYKLESRRQNLFFDCFSNSNTIDSSV